MMYIDPKCLIGRKFYVNNPATQYVAVGFAQNETLRIIGEQVPDPGDKTVKLKAHKMDDCQFIVVPPTPITVPYGPSQAPVVVPYGQVPLAGWSDSRL